MTRPLKSGATAIRNTRRDATIFELRAAGWTLEAIGAHLDLNKSTVHRIIEERLAAQKTDQVTLYRQAVWLQWDEMEVATYDQAYGEHALLDADGKPVMEPITSDGEILLDANGEPQMRIRLDFTDNNAGKAIIAKCLSEKTKLLGLAAPVKTVTAFEQSPAEPITFTVRDGGPRHPTLARLSQAELDDVLRYIADKGYAQGPEKTTKPLAQLMHTFLGGAQPTNSSNEG